MTWVKGQSGNPRGRPKKTKEQVRFEKGCLKLTPRVMEILQEMLEGDDAADRRYAIDRLLNRSMGKELDVRDISIHDDEPSFGLEEARRAMADALRKTAGGVDSPGSESNGATGKAGD